VSLTVDPASPPTTVQFLGHAPECMFGALIAQWTGSGLVDDPSVKAGVKMSLVQYDENGQVQIISGLESSVSDEGLILRSPLDLPAKTPLVAIETYGAPITADLPLFLVAQSYGDWNSVPAGTVKLTVAANLLCQPAL
jgi:hypothetical protein